MQSQVKEQRFKQHTESPRSMAMGDFEYKYYEQVWILKSPLSNKTIEEI